MTEMSRAGARAAGRNPGPPTSSSPTAARGAEAPDGMTTAPALGAQSEGVPEGIYGAPSDPRPSRWRPAFVDNDARPVPTARETVKVKGGML